LGHYSRTASIRKELIFDLLKSRPKLSAASQAMMAYEDYFYYSQRVLKGMTGAHVAAHFGLEGAILGLLNNDNNLEKIDVDSKDSYGQTPLLWAAEEGHEAAVKLLLNTGEVDIESKDNTNKRTPLL
jgi:ankyrin repeat protein